MAAKRIVAFGEVMMRLQVPGYDLLTQADTLRYSFSGTGVNVASALSRFGHEGRLATTLPEGPLGDAALAALRRLGVGDAFVRRAGRSLGMYFLENGFGARPSRVTYADRPSSSFNTAPADAYDVEAIAEWADAAHFCGIALAMNDGVREHAKRLARAVKAKGGTVVFDCNYRPTLWGEDGYAKAKPHVEEMLKLADIAFMNERDAIGVLGRRTSLSVRAEQAAELLPAIAREYGIRAIAGTHRAINGDNSHSLQGFIAKDGALSWSDRLTFAVYDRIGAGDAFASGIVHGELSGWEPDRAVRFAAAAAMLAHTVAGDTPMATAAEVERAMGAAIGDVER